MKGLLADIRHALRLYRATPGSSAIAVIVVAVAMAFVTAFLSLYVDLALKPYPGFEESGRFVTLGQTNGERRQGLSYGLIQRAVAEMTTLDAIAGVLNTRQAGDSGGDPIELEMVTPGFFEGFRPVLHAGRGFEPADHDMQAEPVAVISYRYWQDRFDGREDVLGTTFNFELSPVMGVIRPEGGMADAEDDTNEFRIVGITSPEMRGMRTDNVAFWLPYERAMPMLVSGMDAALQTQWYTLETFGRRSEGASTSAVIRELESRYAGADQEFPVLTGFRLDAIDGLVRDINVQRESKRQLQLFLAGSVLLALVAAANLSLFLAARAPGRRRELGIRMAVGAPLKRLARQLASESALLVVVASAVGIVLSIWLGGFLRGLAFLRQAQWRDVTLFDWRVLALLGAFLLVLTVVVSLAPVLGLRRLGIAASSRRVAARASWSQRIAGTVQVAIAGALGGAAIAFAWHLGSMTLGHLGYETADRYRFSFNPVYFDSAGRMVPPSGPVDAVRQREVLEALPGVRAVTLSSLSPGAQASLLMRPIRDPRDATGEIAIAYGTIDENFVDVLGMTLLYGRAPGATEQGAALVNQSLARLYFGRDNVVGEQLEFPDITGAQQTEIVGVLEDISFVHPAADVDPMLLVQQYSPSFLGGVMVSSLPAAGLQQQLEGLVESRTVELGQPTVRPLTDLRNNLIAPDRARSWLTIATASLVVLLAALGFYGTQRYLVAAGRREYAIRASLGAGPRALGRLVFARGILLSAPGLVVGALLAFIVAAWLRDDLVSRDVVPGVVTLAVVAGMILLLLAASVGPARHARRSQPAPLLREE